jgi:hypothetical protein
MTKLRIASDRINAWQVRIAALAFLVVLVGSSSQVLANALAAGTESEMAALAPKIITVRMQGHTPVSISSLRVHSRRAGIDTPGGYTLAGKR